MHGPEEVQVGVAVVVHPRVAHQVGQPEVENEKNKKVNLNRNKRERKGCATSLPGPSRPPARPTSRSPPKRGRRGR